MTGSLSSRQLAGLAGFSAALITSLAVAKQASKVSPPIQGADVDGHRREELVFGDGPDTLVESLGRDRLRRRGRATNAFSESLGLDSGRLGAFLAGRWTPDLPGPDAHPVRRWVSAVLLDGAVVRGCHMAEIPPGEDGTPREGQVVLTLQFSQTVVNVYPALLAKLQVMACFRPRDAALVASLKLRALEWVKSVGVEWYSAALAVPATVALASRVGAQEHACRGLFKLGAGASWNPYVPSGSDWWSAKQ